jgi:hypothetical protein
MKKPFSRIIAPLIAASFAGFATNALAEVTTTPPPAYSPLSMHRGHNARNQDNLVARAEDWLDGIHPKSEGPSKLNPAELNHMYQCDAPVCRGAR